MRSYRESLEWLYEVAENALREVPADRKPALIGQLRGIASDLHQLDGSGEAQSSGEAANPLEEMLARRKGQKSA